MQDNDTIIAMIHDIAKASDEKQVLSLLFKYSKGKERTYSKSFVLENYRRLKENGKLGLNDVEEKVFLNNIKTKKVRTLSGVTPLTVLTKPYPCPGTCIFCPNDVRMPKSYLSSEPGAQRAHDNKFDPYFQTYNRLVSYEKTGHAVSKIELIILGGTWTAYPESYRVWFVKRCFDAMNDFVPGTGLDYLKSDKDFPYEEEKLSGFDGNYNSIVGKASRKIAETSSWGSLEEAHSINVNALCKCTGLVIETRPDEITKEELIKIRKLGVTKVQMGVQSLDDKVLKLNKRGHSVAQTSEAFKLLRSAGFKIHIHWMPNLYGSDPDKDIKDFRKLFSNSKFRPDEIKIYPCSLIENTELMYLYEQGLWKPYTQEELLKVFRDILPLVPRYCRVTRVVRDISGDDIVAGNRKTNFRQIAENDLAQGGQRLTEIRSREIKDSKVAPGDLNYRVTDYKTSTGREHFMEFVTDEDKIAGFLRLSLPSEEAIIPELEDSAIIREIHVYGESIAVGLDADGKAQHSGLGKKLTEAAKNTARLAGYKKLSVISSIGTRGYYSKLGFAQGPLYQHLELK